MAVVDDAGGTPTGATQSSALHVPLRPTVLIRMTVRLEDFTNDDSNAVVPGDKPHPDKAGLLRDAKKKAEAAAAKGRAAGRPSLADEALLERILAMAAGRPTNNGPVPGTVSPDDDSIILYAITSNYELELNTFRQADKFSCGIPLWDLPILPELIRSMLVDVFLSTTTADDFAHADRWAPTPDKEHIQFRGYVDVATMDAGEDFTVTFSAFSLEQVLMDKDIDPLSKSRRISGGSERVDTFLKRFFKTIPEFSGELGGDPVGVKMYPDVDVAQIPLLDRKLFNRTLQTAQSRAEANGGPIIPPAALSGADPAALLGAGTPTIPAPQLGTKLKAWDVVIRAAEMCGLIPMYDPSVDTDAILLVPPQNLYETPAGGVSIAGGARDGFDRQFLEGGTSYIRSNVRLFCWGRNIRKLRMERKFARNKPRAIQVVSYNPDARGKGKVVVARYPKTPRGVSASARGTQNQVGGPKGHRPVDEIEVVTVRGIRDQGAAEKIAVSLYHAISKRELRCTIETDDLMSFVDPRYPEDPNTDEGADLYKLRPGTPVRIVVARQQTDPTEGLVVNTLSELFERQYNAAFLRQMLRDQRKRAGQFRSTKDEQLLDNYLAKIEKAYQQAKLTDWFFVKTVVHKFDSGDGSGYSCRIEVVNYVEARNASHNLSEEDQVKGNASKKSRQKAKAERQKAIAEQASLDTLMDNALKDKRR